MCKYFNFHEKDVLIQDRKQDNKMYCSERNEEKKDWTPFLSFPVTQNCNFHCLYCGQGGEATATTKGNILLTQIKEIVEISIRNGVKKFRLTGGEPLLHNDIDNILNFFSELGYFTLVNTNGSMILKKQDILDKIHTNIKFAVSLDTLDKDKLFKISHVSCHEDIINGIKYLKRLGLLFRVNMVVGRYNFDEVDDIIKFCQKIGCDLKLLDIVSVPIPYNSRSENYAEISSLEKRLAMTCDEIYSHEYSRGFGTPCYRYKFGDTFVTIKNSVKGSHYDVENGGLCVNCKYFPCHEGLYDIFALSDGRLCSCRWTEKQEYSDKSLQLKFLINLFRRSIYIPKENNDDMGIRTDLIK